MFNRLGKRAVRLTMLTIAIGMMSAAVSVGAGPANDEPLTKTELRSLIVNAKSPADHEQLARYYDAQAAKYEADAKQHEEEASFYATTPVPANGRVKGFYSQEMQSHCPKLAEKLKEAAEQARTIAAGHRQMAKEAQ